MFAAFFRVTLCTHNVSTSEAHENSHSMNQLIETRLATLEQVSEDLLEVRFKPGVKLDRAGILEVLQERKRLCRPGGHHVLAVFPPDGDFEMEVMTMDHYLHSGMRDCTRSLALAANGAMNERMVSLYFAYFPQPFDARVFMDEEEARGWLLESIGSRPLN